MILNNSEAKINSTTSSVVVHEQELAINVTYRVFYEVKVTGITLEASYDTRNLAAI